MLISAMEHHSNIVPWQMLCEEKGASLRVIPITDEGALQLDEHERLLGSRTKLVSIVHLSNVLGTINPVQQMIATAHRRGVPVLIDGSQAAHHMTVDVQALDADFYVFTGHKLYGPTGIGVLRQGALARGDAAVSGWRRHDQVGHVREDHIQRPAVQIRSGDTEHRGRDRVGGGGGLRHRDRDGSHLGPRT